VTRNGVITQKWCNQKVCCVICAVKLHHQNCVQNGVIEVQGQNVEKSTTKHIILGQNHPKI